jgi:hypothetical protein
VINSVSNTLVRACALISLIFMVTACSSGDSAETDTYIKFYNASADAPSIFMTLDEDLDNDADDELERTYSAVAYGYAGSQINVDTGEYVLELAWQSEDSYARSDLTMIYQETLSLPKDTTNWVILSDSMVDPRIDVYSIDLLDDDTAEEDSANDIVNLHFLNLHESITEVDMYLSDIDETFAEAEFITNLSAHALSDNIKIAEDQYILYITSAGSDEVLFASEEMNYVYSGQYLLALRSNQGVGGSDFVVDRIANNSIVQYNAADSAASIRLYNGLNTNELAPEYSQVITAHIQSDASDNLIDGLAYAQFSDAISLDNGDYRLNINNTQDDAELMANRLLSLPQNTNKTLFLYWTEEEVDDDNDGIVDENSDGEVDEIRPIISSLLVDNSDLTGLYVKQVALVNLINTDLFNRVSFYFVKSDEIIATANTSRTIGLGTTSNVTLLNNTYKVFAVASIDNNDIILDELSLTVDETTSDLFLLLEHDEDSSDGFKLRVVDQ